MGYASAIGVFLTVLAVLVGALQLRLLLRAEEY
jgi:ABC-type sugar transport system permease subunit